MIVSKKYIELFKLILSNIIVNQNLKVDFFTRILKLNDDHFVDILATC